MVACSLPQLNFFLLKKWVLIVNSFSQNTATLSHTHTHTHCWNHVLELFFPSNSVVPFLFCLRSLSLSVCPSVSLSPPYCLSSHLCFLQLLLPQSSGPQLLLSKLCSLLVRYCASCLFVLLHHPCRLPQSLFTFIPSSFLQYVFLVVFSSSSH